MNKLEAEKIIKEEVNKLLKENLKVLHKWPLRTVTYEDVVNSSNGKVKLPVNFMSNAVIKDKNDFLKWKDQILSKYGDKGFLVHGQVKAGVTFDKFEITGNPTWEKTKQVGSNAITSFQKGSNYSGD